MDHFFQICYFMYTGIISAETDEIHSAEFCKSPNSDTDAENIKLRSLTKMNHGMIQMPQSYGNESYTECIVTFKGVQSGVIILNHQRQNCSNGPCLLDRVINNTIHEGPCPEQRIYFESMTMITLVKSQEVQPNFVIYFKGMFKDFLHIF